jgi:D-threo-aldose 1-dehydrogenase
VLERVRKIESVCAAHGVRLMEAALRFPLVHPAVVTVLAGMGRPEEVQRNVETLGARIPPALWTDLKTQGLMRKEAPVPA